MKENPLENFDPEDNSEENYLTFDIHRPYVDDIILVSPTGKKMHSVNPTLLMSGSIRALCLMHSSIILLRIKKI